MAKTPSLADVLAAEKAKNKTLMIGRMSDFNLIPQGLPTGNIALDTLTGIGGIPAGRITELFGPPSSGKTTAALQAIAHKQSEGGKACYLDYEGTLDETYCRALGVDTDELVYIQPDSFEEGANVFRKLLATGELDIACFDSVATMVTEKELEADTGKAQVADRAKMMSQFLRQTVRAYRRHDCAAIFLNHVMELIDASPMGQKLAASGVKRKTTPGGTALPFYSSLRVEFKQVGNIRNSETFLLSGQKEDVIRQTKVQATVVKNKVGDPFGTAELRVRFGKGFSNTYSVYKILVDYGVIKKNAAKLMFTDDVAFSQEQMKAFPIPNPQRGADYIVGEENALKAIESDPQWEKHLAQIAENILKENGPQKVDGSEYDHNGMTKDELEEALSVLDSDEISAALEQVEEDA